MLHYGCWMLLNVGRWSLRRYLTFSSRSSVLGVLGVLGSIYYLMIFAPRHFWTLVHKFPIDYYHYFAWLSINQPRLREGKAEENIEVNFSTGAWWRWSQPRSVHYRIFLYVSMWIEWIFGLWEPISGDVVKVINVTHLYFIFHLLRNVFPARAPGQVLRQLGRRRREVARPQLPVSSVRRRGRVRVAGARARDWWGKTAGVDGVGVASLQIEVISSVMVIIILISTLTCISIIHRNRVFFGRRMKRKIGRYWGVLLSDALIRCYALRH